MHVRLAQPSDEPVIAAICACEFFEVDLFGRMIHPRRTEYSQDMQIFWHKWVRNDWANPPINIILAVTAEDDQPVIGAAIWQRQGDDLGARGVIPARADPGRFPALDSTNNRALDAS
jgi:hypothetical protein